MNYKVIFSVIGGGIGWIIGEFKPTFPLIIVAIIYYWIARALGWLFFNYTDKD